KAPSMRKTTLRWVPGVRSTTTLLSASLQPRSPAVRDRLEAGVERNEDRPWVDVKARRNVLDDAPFEIGTTNTLPERVRERDEAILERATFRAPLSVGDAVPGDTGVHSLFEQEPLPGFLVARATAGELCGEEDLP